MRHPHPWAERTESDGKLLDRLQLDRVSLARLRKSIWQGYQALSGGERRDLSGCGTCPRFVRLNTWIKKGCSPGVWERWLRHLDHTQEDIDAMGRGEYPIGPYLIRVVSALCGIKADFLLLGKAPEVDRVGADIDFWPQVGCR